MSNPLPDSPPKGVSRDFGTHVVWFPCDPTRFKDVSRGLWCLSWGVVCKLLILVIPAFVALYFWSQPVLRAHCRNLGEVIWVMAESMQSLPDEILTNQEAMKKWREGYLEDSANDAIVQKTKVAIDGLMTPVTVSAIILFFLAVCGMVFLLLFGYILCASVPTDIIPNGVFLALSPVIMGTALCVCSMVPALGILFGICYIMGFYLHYLFLRLCSRAIGSPKLGLRANVLWSFTVIHLMLGIVALLSNAVWNNTTSPVTVQIASFAYYTLTFMSLGIWFWTQVYYIVTVRRISGAIQRMIRFWYGEEQQVHPADRGVL